EPHHGYQSQIPAPAVQLYQTRALSGPAALLGSTRVSSAVYLARKNQVIRAAMRALAEFVMRGRTQAIAVAALAVSTQLLAIIGVAVVGLVTLRRGARDGAIVMVWAQLPALLYAVLFADVSAVMALLGVTAAAAMLRSSRSWPVALLVAVGAGVISALLFETV